MTLFHLPATGKDNKENFVFEQIVSLFVEDTGKGISEENQKKIFECFYKQDEFDQGTELGLSMCTAIAERLNGKLTILSELGKGSRFAIVIPYTG